MRADRSGADQAPELLPAPDSSLASFRPASWSADGQWLVGDIGYTDAGIVLYSLRSRTFERLTEFGQWPAWLPDGRRVMFVSGGAAFYVVDRVTKVVTQVFSVHRDVIGPPQLARDGRTVFYSRRVTESDIWLVNLR
jgi:Tol biopolymer transport system component